MDEDKYRRLFEEFRQQKAKTLELMTDICGDFPSGNWMSAEGAEYMAEKLSRYAIERTELNRIAELCMAENTKLYNLLQESKT